MQVGNRQPYCEQLIDKIVELAELRQKNADEKETKNTINSLILKVMELPTTLLAQQQKGKEHANYATKPRPCDTLDGCDSRKTLTTHSLTPLMVAGRHGLLDIVEQLIKMGADVEVICNKGKDKTTALKLAIEGNHIAVIKKLSNTNWMNPYLPGVEKPKAYEEYQQTPLFSVFNCSKDLEAKKITEPEVLTRMKALCEPDLVEEKNQAVNKETQETQDTEIKQKRGKLKFSEELVSWALFDAVELQMPNVVDFLFSQGAKIVEGATYDKHMGRSLLEHAVALGNDLVVKRLVLQGAKVTTAMMDVAVKNKQNRVKLLEALCIKKTRDEKYLNEIFQSALSEKEPDPELILCLVKLRVQVNLKNTNVLLKVLTEERFAAKRLEFVDALFTNKDLRVNQLAMNALMSLIKDEDKFLALIEKICAVIPMAAMSGVTQEIKNSPPSTSVQQMLKAADNSMVMSADSKDTKNSPPPNPINQELDLEYPERVNALSWALSEATSRNWLQVVSYLSTKVKLNSSIAFSKALQKKPVDMKIIQAFREEIAVADGNTKYQYLDVNTRFAVSGEKFYWTPLTYVIKKIEDSKQCYSLVKELLDGGADVSMVANDQEKETPLHLAAARGDKELVDLLLTYHPKANALDANQRTPLLRAMDPVIRTEIVTALVTVGVDLNLEDKNGNSPASLAIQALNPEVFLILFNARADMTKLDKAQRGFFQVLVDELQDCNENTWSKFRWPFLKIATNLIASTDFNKPFLYTAQGITRSVSFFCLVIQRIQNFSIDDAFDLTMKILEEKANQLDNRTLIEVVNICCREFDADQLEKVLVHINELKILTDKEVSKPTMGMCKKRFDARVEQLKTRENFDKARIIFLFFLFQNSSTFLPSSDVKDAKQETKSNSSVNGKEKLKLKAVIPLPEREYDFSKEDVMSKFAWHLYDFQKNRNYSASIDHLVEEFGRVQDDKLLTDLNLCINYIHIVFKFVSYYRINPGYNKDKIDGILNKAIERFKNLAYEACFSILDPLVDFLIIDKKTPQFFQFYALSIEFARRVQEGVFPEMALRLWDGFYIGQTLHYGALYQEAIELVKSFERLDDSKLKTWSNESIAKMLKWALRIDEEFDTKHFEFKYDTTGIPTAKQFLTERLVKKIKHAGIWDCFTVPCEEKGKSIIVHWSQSKEEKVQKCVEQFKDEMALAPRTFSAMNLPVSIGQNSKSSKETYSLFDFYFAFKKYSSECKATGKNKKFAVEFEVVVLKVWSFFDDRAGKKDDGRRKLGKDEWQIKCVTFINILIEMMAQSGNKVVLEQLQGLKTLLPTLDGKEVKKFFNFLKNRSWPEYDQWLKKLDKVKELEEQFVKEYVLKPVQPATPSSKAANQALVANAQQNGVAGSATNALTHVQRTNSHNGATVATSPNARSAANNPSSNSAGYNSSEAFVLKK